MSVQTPSIPPPEVVDAAPQQISGFAKKTDQGFELGEMVANDRGKLQFATNLESKTYDKWVSSSDGDRFIPPTGLATFWRTGSLKLPSKAIRGVTSSELITQIKSFIPRYVSLPDDWLTPIALYVLMTWVFDRFRALPYLRFLGEAESGKTRLLEVCGSLCYRSFFINGNVTGAVLYRAIDLIRGTAAVDEADFKSSADWSDITKIFNSGYAYGKPVPRCNQGKNFAPECFDVFGPKIITTRRRFDDNATESRCLTFEVQERKIPGHIPLQLPEAFDREALELRNQLLGWRFDNYGRIAVDETKLRNLNPRMAQVGMTLLAVTDDEALREEFTRFLGAYSEEAREFSPKAIIAAILQEQKSGIQVNALTELVNFQLETVGAKSLSAEQVGSLIKNLGYKKTRRKQGMVVFPGPG
jgi:hypothetical protein